jgi:putative membrane protein
VRRRAAEQFLAKNLHLTRERTGVLIFVSLGEHMAELIADEGIAQHVDPKVWDQAMAALTAGLKRGEPAAGFTAAIGLCADVLAERFPPDGGDNPNELPDKVVILPKT